MLKSHSFLYEPSSLITHQMLIFYIAFPTFPTILCQLPEKRWMLYYREGLKQWSRLWEEFSCSKVKTVSGVTNVRAGVTCCDSSSGSCQQVTFTPGICWGRVLCFEVFPEGLWVLHQVHEAFLTSWGFHLAAAWGTLLYLEKDKGTGSYLI